MKDPTSYQEQESPCKRWRIEKPKTQALDWTRFIIPGAHFIGSGRFGDVHKDEWMNTPDSVSIEKVPRIVMKKFRVSSSQTPDTKARIRVSDITWYLDELTILISSCGKLTYGIVYNMTTLFPLSV